MVLSCNLLQGLQQSRMCFTEVEKMITESSLPLEKLQAVCSKQNSYYERQGLTELTEEELDKYLSMRNACVHYIKACRVFFDTTPDVFAMAIGILDVFLWKVKVTEKHMTIVSAACYLLACKVKEEEEKCPTPRQLASLPFHAWTGNDLCRMESHILRKLHWDLSTITHLDFLPLLSDLYTVDANTVRGDRLLSLAEKCLTVQSTVLFKPVIVALCLFHHATDLLKHLGSHMTPEDFQRLDIKDSALWECMKLIENLSSSSSYHSNNQQMPRKSVAFPMKVFDRPSEIGSTCLPTINEE